MDYGQNVFLEVVYRGHTGKRRPVTVWPDGSITEVEQRDWPPTAAGYRAKLKVAVEHVVPEVDEELGKRPPHYWLAKIAIVDTVTNETVSEFERNLYQTRKVESATSQANQAGKHRAFTLGYREVIPHRSTEVIKNDR
ncbi:hypothetical protein [Evansella halocellulosilytica]|uniref:hypothetical protein n=1 Tax=Evansella halocellulosilytica TaxID=2011013 RepID=UPI000BB73588|nr:hypothetical protein [Evansella halocellulosilytica]